jgi:hypothetical protein
MAWYLLIFACVGSYQNLNVLPRPCGPVNG